MTETVEKTTCVACGREISAVEPDVVLRDPEGEDRFVYHLICEEAARSLASFMDSPQAWTVVRRRMFWEQGD